jgi:immune inhibitor A
MAKKTKTHGRSTENLTPMSSTSDLLKQFAHIQGAARASSDGELCAVAPSPELKEKIAAEIEDFRSKSDSFVGSLARAAEPNRPGFNDGLIFPPDMYPLGTPLSAIRNAALERSPLRGAVRVIVVLVDFSDKHMTQTQAHFRDLFFSTGVIPTKSVREYYTEVTHGLIDIQGDVVGPFRLPMTLAQYAHGASGIGAATPNAQTMARDAVIASDPTVNFTPYDNDGNGFVDAFIVVHAGGGAEQTGNPGDIWSHKWTIQGGARTVDSTKIFGYLTVPEDSKIGVCAHELGHLLFGFPDLYDTDSTSEGIGNWCLMAAGSWGGGGDTPCHPSAWCKANQGWASVDNRTSNGVVSIADVKDSNSVLRLWKDGGPGNEYFLVENRQKSRFDASLPQGGLLIWHIDDSVSTNTNESHYKVALMQADGHRDMELNHNRGDGGDPYPGTSGNTAFHKTSTPNSKSYGGVDTCVSVTAIGASGPVMSANIAVRCKTIEKDTLKEIRDKGIDKTVTKDIRDTKLWDKSFLKDKQPEKPQIDKTSAFDKGFTEKFNDGKFNEGKFSEGGFPGNFGGGFSSQSESRLAQLEARVAVLEAAVSNAGGGGGTGDSGASTFIGSDLRPDLSQGALSDETDYTPIHDQMRQGSAEAKRFYDSKLKEQ